jgi:Flp pilus assembly protein protease CpaA
MLGLLAFAGAASLCEVFRREIPNRLIGLGLVAGLCLNTATSARPGAALGLALVAVALAAAVAFPLWRLGVLGGGDVKLLAACGAFVTPLLMLGLLGHALLSFGLYTMLLFAVEQRLGEALVASTRFILGYPPEEATTRAGSVLHFAPSLLAGCLFTWLS